MKIGAMTTSFRKPFQESLEAAAALKVDGVQIWATDITYYDPNHRVGELDPDKTGEAERKELRARLAPEAGEGRWELYKTTTRYDADEGRKQHGYPSHAEMPL